MVVAPLANSAARTRSERASTEPPRSGLEPTRLRAPNPGPGTTLTNGLTLRALCTSLASLRGQATLDAVLERVGDPIASTLHNDSVRPGGWYPLEWLKALHRAAQAEVHAGPELSRSLGFEGFVRNLRGAHRFFVMVMQPRHMIERAPRLFRLYYDRGELHVLEQHAQLVRLRWDNCPDFDDSMWQDQIGSCEAAVEVTGGRDPRLRVVSGGGSEDDHLELVCVWR